MFPTEIKNKTWGNISHESFWDTINGVYDEIVHSAVMEARRFRSLAKRSEIHPREVCEFEEGSDISKVFAKIVFQGTLSAVIKHLDS